MTQTVRAIDQRIAHEVLDTMLWPGAQPPMLRAEFDSANKCHAHLAFMGFRLIEKRDHYGGPRMEDGQPVSPILLWLKERVLVRLKPRGEPATGKFRQGLAHLSVCLISGQTKDDGSLDTGFKAEVGKFSPTGHLLSASPKSATKGKHAWEKKGAAEEWSDNTHFLFANLVCDDRDVDRLIPGW
ncbi:MAG: hypothetical protein AAGF11_44540 [Myxococcota bacterium]